MSINSPKVKPLQFPGQSLPNRQADKVASPPISRPALLKKLESPDVFQAVLINPEQDNEPVHVQKLRNALKQEPLTKAEVLGNKKLTANLYKQNDSFSDDCSVGRFSLDDDDSSVDSETTSFFEWLFSRRWW